MIATPEKPNLNLNVLQVFREWVSLNLDGLTWQGRFKKEFENFWGTFFEENLSASEYLKRFDYCQHESKIGSLSSWFLWLRDKFLCYLFVYQNYSIMELADAAGMDIPVMATILRNFFTDKFPHLENEISHYFLVGNIASPNVNLTFVELSSRIPIHIPENGSNEEEIMPSMEITLFEEWSPFLRKMKSDFQKQQYDLSKIQEKLHFMNQVKLIQQVLLLLLIFGISIYSIRSVNLWYEKYLANKVSIYEPNLSWLDKSLLFKPKENKPTAEFKLNYNEIKDLAKGDQVTEFFDPESYSEESEVTLTSLESIPKDLGDADAETSQYQEKSAGANGYRETKDGNARVYRVMMVSTNTVNTKERMDLLLKQYEVSQVDNVKPGTDVPGGVYYNIFVPRKNLKEFVGDVMKVETSKLYENTTTVSRNPPGKTRVFIWVKKI